MTDLPSWVPDWSVPRIAYALTFHDEFSSTPATYTAARESKYTKEPQSKSGLVVSGFQFDRIITLGYADKQSMNATAITRRQYLGGGSVKLLWQLSCERVADVRSQKKYVTGEDMLDAHCQTLCAGCTSEAFDAIREEFRSLDEAMKMPSVLHKVHLSSLPLVIMFFMCCLFTQNLVSFRFGVKPPIRFGFTDRMLFGFGRRMARTSKGYIGLVPATAQQGDCVWLLEGGNVPFILREDGRTTRLVGEAYFHGIMTGEAFHKAKCQNIEIV